MNPMLLLFAVLPLSPTAPMLKEKPAERLLNFPVGTQWEYKVGESGNTILDELTEVKEDKEKGIRRVSVQSTLVVGNVKNLQPTRQYELRGGAMYAIADGEIKYEPPLLIFKSGMKKGDRWTQKYKFGDVDWEAEYTVGAEESVTTPAGKYTIIPVTKATISPGRNGPLEMTTWYTQDGQRIKRRPVGGTFFNELQFFKLGK